MFRSLITKKGNTIANDAQELDQRGVGRIAKLRNIGGKRDTLALSTLFDREVKEREGGVTVNMFRNRRVRDRIDGESATLCRKTTCDVCKTIMDSRPRAGHICPNAVSEAGRHEMDSKTFRK